MNTAPDDRPRFETLIADLSTRFIHLPTAVVDGVIEDAQPQSAPAAPDGEGQLRRPPHGAGGKRTLRSRKGSVHRGLTRQIGRFKGADGSTLFLDEIGDLSLEVQAKLLRMLQDGQFERRGSPRTFQANVRVIAASGSLTRCPGIRPPTLSHCFRVLGTVRASS